MPPHADSRRHFLLSGFAWFRPRTLRIANARLRIVRGKKSNRHYLHIHGNEPTAREVLHAHVRKFGGVAFFVQGAERNVAIRGGVIDPNRLFSRLGAERSLRALNKSWTEARFAEALRDLDRRRGDLIKALQPPTNGLLLAVHNNAQGYSIRDEVSGSDQVWLPRPDEPHEFFLATQASDFEIFKKSPYNAALQTSPVPDDGSLSRLSAKMRFRYVNLECKVGNAEAQRQMLRWAETHLP